LIRESKLLIKDETKTVSTVGGFQSAGDHSNEETFISSDPARVLCSTEFLVHMVLFKKCTGRKTGFAHVLIQLSSL